jgi:hypothetical protein
MKARLAPALIALALAACTTPTVYAPMQHADGPGFAETRIEADRWRITFRGGSDAGPERVADLALLRAAQLTLQQGYDWFRVTERFGEALPQKGPYLSVGGGTSSYGWHGGSAVGASVEGIPLGGGAMLSQTLEIIMGKGPTPQGDPAVYDARDVARSIKA